MHRSTWIVSLFTLSCGVPPPMQVSDTSSDLPVAGLSAEWEAAFTEGDALFDVPFREADGLGPLFIRSSCSGCHGGAARGPGNVQRMVQLDLDGGATVGQPALLYGSVVRPFANNGAMPLLAPERADVHLSTRSGIPVMGRGWLEAIDEAELIRVEHEQSLRADGISGRLNRVRWHSERNPDTRFHHYQPGDEVIGRFGVKARQPTLDDFAADALQGDMGLTSPLRPNEVPNAQGITDDGKPGLDTTQDQLDALSHYVRLIAIPRRADTGTEGRAQFEATGCASCHVPSLHTRASYPIAALADKDAAVFTDLLVHDLGPSLSDGLTDGLAGPQEWRTAPLIGLRFQKSFLHDGRAPDVETAIVLHGADGSEAAASVTAFQSLSGSQRQALLAFVSSL